MKKVKEFLSSIKVIDLISICCINKGYYINFLSFKYKDISRALFCLFFNREHFIIILFYCIKIHFKLYKDGNK